MSENDKLENIKFNNNYKVNELSSPSIKKIRSIYESKIYDQNNYSKSKKNSDSEINSGSIYSKREATPKKINKYGVSQKESEEIIEDNKIPLIELVENENSYSGIYNGNVSVENTDNTINNEEENYESNNSEKPLKRKFDDNQEYEYENKYDNEEYEYNINEKKNRLNNIDDTYIRGNEYDNLNSENDISDEVQFNENENEHKEVDEINNEDHDIDIETEDYLAIEKNNVISSQDSSFAIVNESDNQSELKSDKEVINETEYNVQKLYEKSSAPLKNKVNGNYKYDSSSKRKENNNFSRSNNNSNETIHSDPTNSTSRKGLFKFKRFSSKKSSKTEESSKSDETPSKRKGSSSSNKFSSFFYKSTPKKEAENTPSAHLNSVDQDSSNKNKIQIDTSLKNVSDRNKRKRNSTDEEEENNSNSGLERQKVKKIRLLEQEIRTIQQSIELKQQELQMQYDNLIRTRNSLTDPTSEPLPDFISPSSSSDYNPMPPPLNIPKMNRSSRSNYNDYPFDTRSYQGDYDYQDGPFTSSEFRRFNNQRMTSHTKINMENNGRFPNSINSRYPSSSASFGYDEPSFYSNYNFNAKRRVKVRVDPLLQNAINYAKAAGNFECLRYLCEFEKIPNKYIDLRSIEEAASNNDLEELKSLLKHSWFYNIKRFFILLFKIIFLILIFGSILYFIDGLNEVLIALAATYVAICILYNWINRD
ncbi:hypothetical protein H8356DRAFT_1285319 [Neocallimastix lanati (nom. inval.)]|nr:hypothetical protein H8356DRAFT_1285319 [Neocallimastix sp. JGI-2020a]